MKKLILFLSVFFLLVGSATALTVAEDQGEWGVVQLETRDKGIFDFIFESFSIQASPTVAKPGERVTITLGLEIPFDVNRIGKSELFINSPTRQSLVIQDITSAVQGKMATSQQYILTFTVPNNIQSGDYFVSYVIRNTLGKEILVEDTTFKIQAEPTTCPVNRCEDWRFLFPSSDGNGKIESRTCSTFSSAPICTQSIKDEQRTVCNSGFVAIGTNSQVVSGQTTCKSSSNIAQERCGNGVIDIGEVCDGNNLGSVSCSSFGKTGLLTCTSNCQDYATSQCISTQPPGGDGEVEATGIGIKFESLETITRSQLKQSVCNNDEECKTGKCIAKESIGIFGIFRSPTEAITGLIDGVKGIFGTESEVEDKVNDVLKEENKQGICILDFEDVKKQIEGDAGGDKPSIAREDFTDEFFLPSDEVIRQSLCTSTTQCEREPDRRISCVRPDVFEDKFGLEVPFTIESKLTKIAKLIPNLAIQVGVTEKDNPGVCVSFPKDEGGDFLRTFEGIGEAVGATGSSAGIIGFMIIVGGFLLFIVIISSFGGRK